MLNKLMLPVFILLVFVQPIFGQSSFPYNIRLEPLNITGLSGLHSFAAGQQQGKWVLIGGRLDGIHARQPFNAFPASQNNTEIFVVDPEAGELWTSSLNALTTSLQEQLQSTNMQFFQDGDQLILIGGYGYSATEGEHLTFPFLTAIDLPGLISDIVSGSQDIAPRFEQINHEVFAVTGGYLGKISDTFYLVGGHRFDGRYNPMNHPTFTQTYTDGIKQFNLVKNGDELTFENYTFVSDPVHLHRRDFNLLPQIFPDGAFGYTLFSGVFQINYDLPFLYPVDITAGGHQANTTFNQYLSNYHSAHLALYDNDVKAMHNLFFGGISQYYYSGETIEKDDDVPFVKTISLVSRTADGRLEEFKLPESMPGLLGASAELILNEALPLKAPEIIDLSEIQADSFLVGYIVGGIQSQTQHPFTFNNSETTAATATIYRVYLSKNPSTAIAELPLAGYHKFKIKVFPNPSDHRVFRLQTTAPEGGKAEVFLVTATGEYLVNEEVEGLQAGSNEMEINLINDFKGVAFLTVVLNGKYFSTEKVVFE